MAVVAVAVAVASALWVGTRTRQGCGATLASGLVCACNAVRSRESSDLDRPCRHAGLSSSSSNARESGPSSLSVSRSQRSSFLGAPLRRAAYLVGDCALRQSKLAGVQGLQAHLASSSMPPDKSPQSPGMSTPRASSNKGYTGVTEF